MDFDIRIYDILDTPRIEMVGEKELEGLTDMQQKVTLLIKYSVSQSSHESVVAITFIDYLTERPIATCTGAFGLGMGMNHDLKVATNRAFDQVHLLFSIK